MTTKVDYMNVGGGIGEILMSLPMLDSGPSAFWEYDRDNSYPFDKIELTSALHLTAVAILI